MDPLDSGVGAHDRDLRQVPRRGRHRLRPADPRRQPQRTTSASTTSYVGTLLGQGLVSCVAAWGVKKPKVIVMQRRADRQQRHAVRAGLRRRPRRRCSPPASGPDVANPAGTWDPPTAAEPSSSRPYTAHQNINAALIPNDENAARSSTTCRRRASRPKTFPITGQDATLIGLQNILSGYQCGTVYKPIYLEAQAAAALAMYAAGRQDTAADAGQRQRRWTPRPRSASRRCC